MSSGGKRAFAIARRASMRNSVRAEGPELPTSGGAFNCSALTQAEYIAIRIIEETKPRRKKRDKTVSLPKVKFLEKKDDTLS